MNDGGVVDDSAFQCAAGSYAKSGIYERTIRCPDHADYFAEQSHALFELFCAVPQQSMAVLEFDFASAVFSLS